MLGTPRVNVWWKMTHVQAEGTTQSHVHVVGRHKGRKGEWHKTVRKGNP